MGKLGHAFLGLILAAAVPPAVRADGTGAAPSLDDVLARFSQAQRRTDTIQARFEERRELALLKGPVVQRGTFYHSKPHLYLWDYERPTPKRVLLTSEVLLAYYPDLNKAEEVNVRRWTNRIRRYLGVGEDPEALRADYDVTLASADQNDLKDTDLLVCVPRQKRMREKLREVRIWLDSRTSQARRVAYEDADGDRTTFTFTDIRVNQQIDPSRYQIDLPKDVARGDRFTGFSGG